MSEVEQIARSLTKAQIAMISDLPIDRSWVRMFPLERYASFGVNALRGFGKSGLVEGDYSERTTLRYRLTPLGEQVRALLAKEQPE